MIVTSSGSFSPVCLASRAFFSIKVRKSGKKEKKKFPLGFLFFSPSNDLFTNLMGKNRFCLGRLGGGGKERERNMFDIYSRH